MSKQSDFHKFHQPKKGYRLSHADIQEHKNKENLIGHLGLVKLGHPSKQSLKKPRRWMLKATKHL